MIRIITLLLTITLMGFFWLPRKLTETEISGADTGAVLLTIRQDKTAGTISVFRGGSGKPLLVQNALPEFRPYIHPILAPDGKGVLTEFSPGHHKHQTGLYWGFTRVNGRDFFHNPGTGFWKRTGSYVIQEQGSEVKWQTVYNLLDERGSVVLTETQNWAMRQKGTKYVVELEWKGEAKTDITIGKYDYGGLFLRMPWKEGINGEVVNAARQRNERADGQPAMWVDVAMQVEGRDDLAHIAIFDHPENKGYPQQWRVDSQLGVGPSRARTGDWTISKGETEVIRHQFVVYTGKLNDVELTSTWGEFSGNNSMYSTAELWAAAQREGREAKFLTPQEAVKSMTLKDGFKANVWASEPMMTQPMAFCWDDRGRMWIAENKDYESRGHGFSNAGDSRILILEDTNGDGAADKRTVFMEGIAFPSALAVGFDGVFVGAPPNLLFIPDRNKDDKADKDIEVRLTGWGIRDRHETLNSFHWGPDGWLYGLQGFATPSKVRKPAGKGRLYKHNDPFPEDILEGEGTDINGGVWRYHPTKDKFEVVAHGFSNPWGIDYDAKGQLFISACVIPHMWYVVPGGIYHRQGGQHFNPYVYSDIRTITDHSHRSAHGGARIYQSDAFPETHRGRIFMANIHEHAVLSDVLKPKGSGFTASHGDDFLLANNAQWVGFSMEVGPEGGLYVLDWHDADICGQEVLNAETGRIFRIVPQKTLAENWKDRFADLDKLADKQLVELQTSKSDWHARRARGILQNRAAKGKLHSGTHPQLLQIFKANSNPDWRLRAMWALHITGGFTGDALTGILNDKDPHIRAWAIQLLCEDRKPSAEALTKFAKMAAADQSPVVRLYLASALQRIAPDARWDIASALMKHKEDAADHNIPKMIWYGVEPLVAKNSARALAMAAQTQLPMLAEYSARRAVDANAVEALVEAIGKMPATTAGLLEGMLNGLEGRTDLKPPANWNAVSAKLKKSGGKNSRLALQVSEQFGDTEAANRSMATLKNKTLPAEQRRKALLALAAQQKEIVVAELPALLDDARLRHDAIRAIAAFDKEELGTLLIKRYPTFSDEDKKEAIQTLSSRPGYGWLITTALKEKTIPKRDVSATVARQLRRVVGSGFVEIWGPIDEVPADKQTYAKYKSLLTDKMMVSADLKKGQLLFKNTCGSCHKLYGEGGIIGPDLTGSNRNNLNYLLLNVLEPGAEIQDDYKMVVVTTRDGRTYSGNIASENERQLTLRVVGQDAVVINKSTIQSREITPVSMMPTGLFETLEDKEIIDLVAYLRTMK